MDLGLQGLRALVTGGTRGIGRAIVEVLTAEGASVGFCARTECDVADTVEALTNRGSIAAGIVLDVADEAGIQRWVADSAAEFDGLDIVVANVSALAIPDEAANWRTSFDVDLMGTVSLVKAAMPYLERSTAASILTISSVSGREIDFAAGPYGVFKAAIIHYTRGWLTSSRRKASGPTAFRRATPTSPVACGRTSSSKIQSCSPRLWR
jgi:3-oxoacyl-[acyl-carrier protein] reductase